MKITTSDQLSAGVSSVSILNNKVSVTSVVLPGGARLTRITFRQEFPLISFKHQDCQMMVLRANILARLAVVIVLLV